MSGMSCFSLSIIETRLSSRLPIPNLILLSSIHHAPNYLKRNSINVSCISGRSDAYRYNTGLMFNRNSSSLILKNITVVNHIK